MNVILYVQREADFFPGRNGVHSNDSTGTAEALGHRLDGDIPRLSMVYSSAGTQRALTQWRDVYA
jgi:hypothetical protein